ncbi:MAG: NAD-dependent epimerase/dehydratase family protein, partial [Myxococcota bacterium]|nr:NAD-dependent epimerase/dehydratase family protein [Myxococcota bacterium]
MALRALVTGANGFVGSHLVDHLRERGDKPLAMVRQTSDLTNLEGSDVEFRYAGLSDVEAMTLAMRDVDIVFHVAGLTAAFKEETLTRVNSEGTANVFEAARRAEPGPRRVVCISSLEAAGPSTDARARSEEQVAAPFTRYGRSKLGGERAAWEARRDREVVIVRPPLVYGPRDQDVLQMIQGANM